MLTFFSCLLFLRPISVGIWRKDLPQGSSAKGLSCFRLGSVLGSQWAVQHGACLLPESPCFIFYMKEQFLIREGVTMVFLKGLCLLSAQSVPALLYLLVQSKHRPWEGTSQTSFWPDVDWKLIFSSSGCLRISRSKMCSCPCHTEWIWGK